MQTFECHNFTLVAHNLGTLQGEFSNKKPDEVRSAKNRKIDKGAFQTWLLPLEELNMPLTKRQVERAMEALDSPITCGAFSRLLQEIHSRLQDEFERGRFLYLFPEEATLLDAEGPLFGPDVAAKFPAATEDISEAGKCLALGRYTATVFHLMRVMELALQKLGDVVGVKLAGEKNWQNILDEVNKAIKGLDHKRPLTKSLAEVSSHLYGVKIAWRNEVMHPKQTYTPDESRAIFDHAKTFMRELATVISEAS